MLYWSLNVFRNTAHTAYSKVFGQWYFNTQGELRSGVAKVRPLKAYLASWTTHLGSVSYGSFLISVIQALRVMLRVAEAQNNQNGNAVVRILVLIILRICQCLLGYIEAIMGTICGANNSCRVFVSACASLVL